MGERTTLTPAAASSASSAVVTASEPFVNTVSCGVQCPMSRARSARSLDSPIRARLRPRSSHASQAAQLNRLMP